MIGDLAHEALGRTVGLERTVQPVGPLIVLVAIADERFVSGFVNIVPTRPSTLFSNGNRRAIKQLELGLLQRPLSMHENPLRMLVERSLAQRPENGAFLIVGGRLVESFSRIGEEPVHKTILFDKFLVRLLVGVSLPDRGD